MPHLTVSTVLYSTEQYRKRKEEKAQEGIVKRKYTKSSSIVKCPKCGQERKSPAHQPYTGFRYCMHADVVTIDASRADLQAKGVARKSKIP
jgi:ribosomal protein L37AE/L43A